MWRACAGTPQKSALWRFDMQFLVVVDFSSFTHTHTLSLALSLCFSLSLSHSLSFSLCLSLFLSLLSPSTSLSFKPTIVLFEISQKSAPCSFDTVKSSVSWLLRISREVQSGRICSAEAELRGLCGEGARKSAGSWWAAMCCSAEAAGNVYMYV